MDHLHESLRCPSCGHNDFDPEKQCTCGYHADESFIVESFIMESERNNIATETVKEKSPTNIVKRKNNESSRDFVIKEIDSWVFSFSQDDQCIYLGTPALKSFKLKLTIADLEELLEFVYKKTGQEKTTRKLRLSDQQLKDVVEKVYGMIEYKRSQIAIKFTNAELQEVADLINTKLKV